MKIGVTGGAGYIGSTLVVNLVENGHEVVSIDNQRLGDYRYLQKTIGDKARLVVGDIRDQELLLREWEGCEAIAHLAALPGLVLCNQEPEEAISVNIYGTHQVGEAAKKLGVKRLVFCSSAATYGIPKELPVTEDHPLNPVNLYGVTKVAGELILNTYHHNFGLETVNLRFGNIYGVGLYTRWGTVIPKFVKQALTGEPLTVYGDGEYSRDFVHVQDITNALYLSLTKEGVSGETFNVGGETLTINQVASIVAEEVEKETGIHVEKLFTPPRVGEAKRFSYDLSKIRRGLGFKNEWTVRRGVRQLIRFYLETQRER